MSTDKPEMNLEDVLEFINLLEQNQIIFQIDGGWGAFKGRFLN
ncbi:MAG: hypothetical protein WCK35_28335 [Chloroflexota bacterium]